jgi:Arc/MetJ-type ribon-helix-helix transcriptional regulator
MNTSTITVSIPSGLKRSAERLVRKGRFTSISEVVSVGIKKVVSSKETLTENGFSKEFEEHVLQSAKEPKSKSRAWSGRGSFSNAVNAK